MQLVYDAAKLNSAICRQSNEWLVWGADRIPLVGQHKGSILALSQVAGTLSDPVTSHSLVCLLIAPFCLAALHTRCIVAGSNLKGGEARQT